ncbi:hypothetical protein P8S54_09860 [Thiomicrospira sp. R3]|uniref:hypothetical protein n=1 Tax=Thiomicrospira sp. R3 TaxID=3035472 RepID=UPI00259B8A40|nr:hypothetical protein [Thiomicrospira sp. R3]WFE68501.1 hypothetical protein P8S54_09860 [Thiomicrospira sp. R3]
MIAQQLSRPNPDTFKYFVGKEKQQEIKKTQLVVMGLSILTDQKSMLSKLHTFDWATLCSDQNLGINWQQNIRTIKTFSSLNKDVRFIIVCSEQSASLFTEFKNFIEHLERETAQKIHLEQAANTVDINSIASCSRGIKKILNNHAAKQVVIDITSATKQYSAACTLETTYREMVYLGYVSNDANYFIYNVLNEERGELMM